jgi:hypothetical protein
MGSSFLTTINVGLSLYSIILFLKSVIQFGLPNHPARFLLYLVSLCACVFFTLKALTGLGYISPIDFLRWRALPMVAGSLAMLLQIITTVGQFSMIQQKVISRIPLMAALLVYAFFPTHADIFFGACILAGVLFFSISVGKARYQKRMFFKFTFFLCLPALLALTNIFWIYVIGQLFLFFVIFYFYIFQQTFGISALIEKFQVENSGVPS